jgi:AcrR family transcriptional regulator
MAEGKNPSIEEVAEEALVSRATAYRYFSSREALLVEAPMDLDMPEPAELLDHPDAPTDPLARLDLVDAAIHRVSFDNEAQARNLLKYSMERWFANRDGKIDLPVRQGRRVGLLSQALEPVRDQLSPEDFDDLIAALSLVASLESMIVFRDVMPIEPDRARRVKQWAIHALVQTMLDERGRESGDSD